MNGFGVKDHRFKRLTTTFFKRKKSGSEIQDFYYQFLSFIKKVYETRELLWGDKGVLPLRCLPLWEREGVTIIVSSPKRQ
jgi:hypothetical protein